MTPKKKKTAIIIITIVAALVIIYIICALTGNLKPAEHRQLQCGRFGNRCCET